MAQTINLKVKCPQCHGTGTFEPSSGPGSTPLPCNWPGCGATGYVFNGIVELDPGLDDLLDKQADILDKLDDILEKLNA